MPSSSHSRPHPYKKKFESWKEWNPNRDQFLIVRILMHWLLPRTRCMYTFSSVSTMASSSTLGSITRESSGNGAQNNLPVSLFNTPYKVALTIWGCMKSLSDEFKALFKNKIKQTPLYQGLLVSVHRSFWIKMPFCNSIIIYFYEPVIILVYW